jgi:hypothetical protein
MAVIVDDDPRRPWVVNPDAEHEGIRYNVNDPSSPGKHDYTFSGGAGTSITVEATSWNQSGFEPVAETVERNGEVYDQKRATGIDKSGNDGGRRVSIEASAGAGENETNLIVLSHENNTLPANGQAAPFQRDMEKILSEAEALPDNPIGDDNQVQLDESQFLFIYELSKEDAKPENADDSDEDPDYNDAVVLLDITQAEQAEDNFFVHVTVSQVRVEEGG